ncbi:hypothetical protein [Tautonia marina]|uniref:hypothetical protein n=1 Tax=Tautonia marina TaxID=2653855 RepID=UPI0012608901|nr:hypothetical protein [Tautonia marina]
MRVRSIFLLGLMVSCPASAAVAQVDGDALAGRFLAHIESVAPVGGTFMVETRFDPELMEADRAAKREWAEAQGYGIDLGPEAPVLHCEWAWDGTRESLKTLDGSNKFAQFYLTPEAYLDGMAERNYNLTLPTRPGDWRPASFYLLGGSTPWSSFLEGARFASEPAPAGSPDGSILLVARSRGKEVRLLIDERDGTLHRAEIDMEGSPYSRLDVEELDRAPDGRVFPSRARLTIHKEGQPYQFMTLKANRIVFRPDEVADALAIELPASTRVHDRVLNRAIPLSEKTSAQEFLTNYDPSASDTIEPPMELPSPAQATVHLPSSGQGRPAWVIGLGLVVLAAIGVWFFLKGGRMWDEARPGRS